MVQAAHSEDRSGVIERLRQQIAQVQAAPRQLLLSLPTGLREVDALGLFRLGGVVELTGEEASGRTSLALRLVASACRERRLAAWVDGPAELYPPAAQALGGDLKRLLIVRPKAPGQLVWAAVQLLRSGAFTCVVLDVTHTGVRLGLADTRKLVEAARAGGALLVLLTSLTAQAQGLVRLSLRAKTKGTTAPVRHLRVVSDGEPAPDTAVEPDFEAEVLRASGGALGRTFAIPRGDGLRRARFRQVASPDASPAPPRVRPAESFQRPKRTLDRDGPGMPGGGRPGRDSRLELAPRPARPPAARPRRRLHATARSFH